jgi:hypothetical protein
LRQRLLGDFPLLEYWQTIASAKRQEISVSPDVVEAFETSGT